MRTRLTLFVLPFLAMSWGSVNAKVEDYYFGDYYTYKKAELYESAIGGQISLLRPAGFDHFPTDWLPESILLQGEISAESAGVVARLLRADHKIRSIYMDSPGGDLLAGMQIGRLIAQAGLTSIINVEAQCQSACALAFLAGKQRYILSDTADFGFHRQYYIINNRIAYDPWVKDVKEIANYLAKIQSTSIRAEEIVGTTGQVSMSQERLRERGITTIARDKRWVAIAVTAGPTTTYERFRAACYIVAMSEVCKEAQPLLREPAIRIWAILNGNTMTQESKTKLARGFVDLQSVYAKAGRKEIFEADCRVLGQSISEHLDTRLAEISLYIPREVMLRYMEHRNRLSDQCLTHIEVK